MSINGNKEEKKKRPKIPEDVRRELWARAAGRCEFKGCNKCIYKDLTTQKRRNVSEIAHIISWTPDGPRGNAVDSERLATDISNLMLTCPEHNNLIDDKKYVAEYPVELLRKYKKDHEDRVYRLTGLGEEYSHRVIELVSTIHGQTPSITEQQELDALLPYYPKENPIRIDLTGTDNIDEAKRIIDQRVSMYISDTVDNESYAAFIMAKIPYACYLGYAIGNKTSVSTYQRFRDTDDWKWREQSGGTIEIMEPCEQTPSANVNLLIDISGVIDTSLIPRNPCYRIKADAPGFMFLQNQEQVVEFRMKYREILDIIRNQNGERVTVHLFVAAPIPFCFEIGRTIMRGIDPSIILYDKVSNSVMYEEVMHLHDRVRG